MAARMVGRNLASLAVSLPRGILEQTRGVRTSAQLPGGVPGRDLALCVAGSGAGKSQNVGAFSMDLPGCACLPNRLMRLTEQWSAGGASSAFFGVGFAE